MQNTQETSLGAEMLRVGGNLQKCLGTRLEQQLEQGFLVLPDEGNQRMRHAEHQVVVVYGQQVLLASGQPLITGVGLAVQSKYSCGMCIIPEQASQTLPAFNAVVRATPLGRLREQEDVALPLMRTLGMKMHHVLLESAS